jgi:hypothetical protein
MKSAAAYSHEIERKFEPMGTYREYRAKLAEPKSMLSPGAGAPQARQRRFAE